jgi:hypothetical protein
MVVAFSLGDSEPVKSKTKKVGKTAAGKNITKALEKHTRNLFNLIKRRGVEYIRSTPPSPLFTHFFIQTSI